MTTAYGSDPLKHHVVLNPDVWAETTPDDTAITYVDIGSVEESRGIIDTQELNFGAAPSRARRRVRPNDVIVSTVRTYLRAVARIPPGMPELTVSTGFAVLRPRATIDPRFLYYAVVSKPFIDQVVASSVGVSYPAINASDLVRLPIPVPSRAQQRAIADYLDRETARIDGILQVRRRTVQAIEERFRAQCEVIFEDPDWVPTRLKRLLRSPLSYGVLVPQYVDDGGVPFIRVGDLASLADWSPGTCSRFIDPRQSVEYKRTVLASGDLLVSVVGSLDQAAVVPRAAAGANIARAVARVQLRNPLHARLLFHWTKTSTYQLQAALVTVGDSVQPTLNMSDLSQFSLRIPPTEQALQRAVIALEEHSEIYTKTVASLHHHMELLGERRAALITAAVTGQIEVSREAA